MCGNHSIFTILFVAFICVEMPLVFGDCNLNSSTGQNCQNSGNQLPSWCFDPPGNNCEWYPNCLEVAHPCNGTSSNYALGFAYGICQACTETVDTYSDKGIKWILAVRPCLQRELVPVMRRADTMTCKQIQDEALKTHPGCYLNPAPGAPSFCELDLRDMIKIFWTIKKAFLTLPISTTSASLDILWGCMRQKMLIG